MRDIFEENLNSSIFTKEDGKLLKAELKAELKTDTSELRTDMFRLKSEMIVWMIGLLLAQTTIMISIIKFLF